MKKTLLLSLLLTGAFASFPIANASAAVNSNSAVSQPQQWNRQPGRRWRNNRTYIQTRVVRHGRFLYRETYRVTIHNGFTKTKLISRDRIGR